MEYLLTVVGFVFLIVGADIFVEGSSNIAKALKVPSIIIGLTIVAFGTSMPEASVSINASLLGQNSLAVSNAVGSNIFNLLVVLGASALLCPVKVDPTAIKKEIPFSIVITVVLGFLLAVNAAAPGTVANASTAEGFTSSLFTLDRLGGVILLLLFSLYMFWQIKGALKARKQSKEQDVMEKSNMSVFMSVALIILGLAGIILGGNMVVQNASIIAQNFGMSQTFIGLTIVAIGTSLPELVTSMVAAKKGESDLAMGNVIGSNIFNVVFILGFSAVLSPMAVDFQTICDIIVLIAISVLCWFFAKTKQAVSRTEGGIMLLIYIAYFVYILLR